MSIRRKQLPIAALERIDDLCADFERKWQANESPTIESMVPEGMAPSERDVLVAELIALDAGLSAAKRGTTDETRLPDAVPRAFPCDCRCFEGS